MDKLHTSASKNKCLCRLFIRRTDATNATTNAMFPPPREKKNYHRVFDLKSFFSGLGFGLGIGLLLGLVLGAPEVPTRHCRKGRPL